MTSCQPGNSRSWLRGDPGFAIDGGESRSAVHARTHGAVRLKIRHGELDIGSLQGPGFASGAYPDWEKLKPMD